MIKKRFLLIAVLVVTNLINASTFNSRLPGKINAIENKNLHTIYDVYKMKAGELKILLGRKLSLKDRVAFVLLKTKLKNEIIKGNGNKNIYTVLPVMMEDEKRKFRWGGFLLSFLPAALGTVIGGPFLGLLLGLLGVGYVHWFKKNKDKEYNRAAWIGLAVWLFLLIVVAALILVSFDFSFGV